MMILANIIFGTRRKNDPGQLEDIVENYLAMLLHSGQICGDYFLTWTKGRLNAHVLLAGRNASGHQYHSIYGKKALKKVVSTFGVEPVWRLLGDNAASRSSSWKGAPFLYLFTHAFDRASPVCRGDGKPPVPVFLLPLAFEQKDQLFSWQQSYQHHDNLWLGSGALEIAAHRQMTEPTSELAKEGRSLCRKIETATGLPTFYYLTHYWGRSKGEQNRPCPGCGAAWKTGCARPSPPQFWHFDFKCDRCRLVSHMSVATGGGRHTKIGEYDKNGKRVRQQKQLKSEIG